MKKLLFSIFSICLCAICVISLAGCKPIDYGATTTDTSKVSYNGGASCVYNGELYFINGTKTNTAGNNGGTVGSIYKVKINDKGEVSGKYTKVVDALVGYKNGSITIMGNFLYYASPCSDKNKNGEVLYNKTTFYRKNLVNGKTQPLYTTVQNSDSEQVDYAYYKLNGTVNLVVYEKTESILTSFKIDNKVTENFKKTNVTSAVFSENMGESKTGKINADNYIFYTLSAEPNAVNSSANRLYRISANGKNQLLLSDSANISLLSIRAGKLIFSVTFGSSTYKVENIYAYEIDDKTQKGAIAVTNPNNSQTPSEESGKYVISSSENTYSDIMFLEEGDNKDELAILCVSGKVLSYIKYSNGTMVKDIKLYTFSSTPTMDFVGTYHDTTEDKIRDYVVFTSKSGDKNLLYKLQYNFEDQTEVSSASPDAISLSTTKAEEANGIIVPKLIGNYVYFYASDEDKNILLYRANIYTPKDLEAQSPSEEPPTEDKLKVGEAQFIGQL